ncbi:MAG TPA: MogA/MoaB family molybdenum cofactor biosynthesis protein [Pirellulales bacterium]|jgi:molybdenum cofactor biosynthesis protein B|nr:MogA/MoaB family molybdenum cofactor biosynthesis protein [Pirellulales bacterium]
MSSASVQEHRAQSPTQVFAAVITISDTRTLENDTSGRAIVDPLKQAGHQVVAWEIVPDEPDRIRQTIAHFQQLPKLDAILLTGGTGVGSRDQTFETISGLLTKTMPGFGEIFRMLSYQEIGAAAMLSRAIGGLIDRTIVLAMPGSTAAVRLAMEKLILPEIGHLVREARR